MLFISINCVTQSIATAFCRFLQVTKVEAFLLCFFAYLHMWNKKSILCPSFPLIHLSACSFSSTHELAWLKFRRIVLSFFKPIPKYILPAWLQVLLILSFLCSQFVPAHSYFFFQVFFCLSFHKNTWCTPARRCALLFIIFSLKSANGRPFFVKN